MNDNLNKLISEAEELDTQSKLHPNLPLVKELRAIVSQLKALVEKEPPEMPEMEMEYKMVFPDGVEVVTLKGDKGNDGHTPTKDELVSLIEPLIPEPKNGINGKNGKDGYTPVKGVDYFDGEDGLSPSVEDIAQATSEKLTPLVPKKEEIIEEVLKSDKLKDVMELDKSDIIQKITSSIKEIQERFTSISSSGGFGSRRVYIPMRDNFTSLTDGSTRIFYLSKAPLKSDTIQVFCTDYPIVLNPDVDFTIVGKTLTLSSSFPAPSTGSTFLIFYHA